MAERERSFDICFRRSIEFHSADRLRADFSNKAMDEILDWTIVSHFFLFDAFIHPSLREKKKVWEEKMVVLLR